ncbi:MAG: hypothetical protein ACOCX1_04205 [Fimbriimonadaceae bacterium]
MSQQAQALVAALHRFIDRSVKRHGGTQAVRPGDRIPFHWPPHMISQDFHVAPEEWAGRAEMTIDGETFEVHVARTASGVFGRSEQFWNEAHGNTLEEMLESLRQSTLPLLNRQKLIAETIGRKGRFEGDIRHLPPAETVMLLYCPDRDVCHEALTKIESSASTGIYTPALIEILRDERHPNRRSAQWAVLDMFEDLPSFCPNTVCQSDAVQAIKALAWNAEDDHARTVYKAGVVLGGHICTEESALALLDLFDAPSKYGRRSAYHAVFHLAEWMPEYRPQILEKLNTAAEREPLDSLREFAACMARDIGEEARYHVDEPLFEEEAPLSAGEKQVDA